MNRVSILSFFAVAGGSAALLAGSAQSQSGTPKNLVQLQASTPGVSQSGHTNISGTARAGQFVGGGAGLTNVDASLLGGLPSSSFLQSIPNPLSLSGSTPIAVINGTNSATTGSAAAVRGDSTATTGTTIGVFGTSVSPSGFGVAGRNNATTGAPNGVYGQVSSPTGYGVFGNNLSSTGVATGVYGANASPDGIVIQGIAFSTTGVASGGLFQTNSNAGIGVHGLATNVSGSTVGVKGTASSASGIGVNGIANANSGQTFGVFGQTQSPSGAGVAGSSLSATGVTTGVLGQTVSTGGNGVAGFSLATTGATNGVFGQTQSSGGTGVAGIATSATGVTYALQGLNQSSSGIGMLAIANSLTGTTIGASGRSDSSNGTGVVGFVSAGSGTTRGVYGISNSPNGSGGFFENPGGGIALAASGTTGLSGNLLIQASGRISVNAGNPLFPLDFPESVGDKISLFGTSASSHYGFGIQGNLLQVFSDLNASAIAFGYGGSNSFTERARFSNTSDLEFQHANTDSATEISTPYDLIIGHDRDNDSSDSWLRLYTNGFVIEQFRVEDGDEAPALFDGAVNANGIDYAEAFKIMDPSLEAGDLVVNMGSSWEHITRSTKAYDSGVIGVISTKPAFVAGMSFDAEDKINPELTKRRDAARKAGDRVLEKQLTVQMTELVKAAYRPVAFMGRVPVKVTGRVQVGDHLTSSNIPGVAMAMNMSGQSIGIALESNPGGNGKIMVMIQPKYWTPTIPTGSGGLTEVVAEMKKKMDAVIAENRELRKDNQDLRRSVADLAERLDRLERAMKSR